MHLDTQKTDEKHKQSDDHQHGHAHHAHDHEHARHEHNHEHTHEAGHHCNQQQHNSNRCCHNPAPLSGRILVLRPQSGISGDMFLAGLAFLCGAGQTELDQLCADLGLTELKGAAQLAEKSVNQILGLHCRVTLPHEHAHRSLADILRIIADSPLAAKEPRAAELASKTFELLAQAEGAVHGKPAAEVTFHEVGALDSILDICLACALFSRLAPDHFICGPLPLCDGQISCAHGLIPSPAPAVLRLLEGCAVRGLDCRGELVTPTGLALLKAFGATFGPWPQIVVSRQTLVYGNKEFPNIPNGAIFALGEGGGHNRFL